MSFSRPWLRMSIWGFEINMQAVRLSSNRCKSVKDFKNSLRFLIPTSAKFWLLYEQINFLWSLNDYPDTKRARSLKEEKEDFSLIGKISESWISGHLFTGKKGDLPKMIYPSKFKLIVCKLRSFFNPWRKSGFFIFSHLTIF